MIYQDAPGGGRYSNTVLIFVVGLTWVRLQLLLRLTEQRLVQHVISVEATFPSQAHGAVHV